MKMTVFSEYVRETTDKNGQNIAVHVGDDALPYVDDRLLLIADGIGGASAFRHEDFNQDIFNLDKIVHVFFDGTLETQHPVFQDYVKRAFFDFCQSENFYHDSRWNRRTSAFFGSRIATALIINKFLTDEKLLAEEGGIFDQYNALQTKAEKDDFLQTFGNELAVYLKENMGKAAVSANFHLKANKMGNSILFGTTLCMAVYRENKQNNEVEIFYVVAGDSRPCMIDAEGMHQMLADCENSDGTLTSFVCADQDMPLNFTCKYQKLKTPCILLNSSDGCFDTVDFYSPLCYEKLILDTILQSKDLEEVSSSLRAFFDIHGRHDDSGTMAMKLCGFHSYDEVQRFAADRLKKIETQYLQTDKDVLHQQYSLQKAKASGEDTKLKNLKFKLKEDENVIRYCEEILKEQDSNKEPVVCGGCEEDLEQRITKAYERAIAIIHKNYFLLCPMQEDPEKRQAAKDLKNQCDKAFNEFMQKAKEAYEKAQKYCMKPLDYLFEFGSYDDKKFYGDTVGPFGGRDFKKAMDKVVKKCEQIRQYQEKGQGARIKLETFNEISVSKEQASKLFERYLSGELALDRADLFSEEKEKLQNIIDGLKDLQARCQTQPMAAIAPTQEKIQSYIEENAMDLIRTIVEKCEAGMSSDISFELYDELKAYIKATTIPENLAELVENQQQVFKAYDKTYYAYLCDEKDEELDQLSVDEPETQCQGGPLGTPFNNDAKAEENMEEQQ